MNALPAQVPVFRIARIARSARSARSERNHMWSLRGDDGRPSVVLFDRRVDARRVAAAMEAFQRGHGHFPAHTSDIATLFTTYYDPGRGHSLSGGGHEEALRVETADLREATEWALTRNIGVLTIGAIQASVLPDRKTAVYTVPTLAISPEGHDVDRLRAACVADFEWQMIR